jgi:peptidoglycan L-alanyl-D-glutamate endopeptidase CwlK
MPSRRLDDLHPKLKPLAELFMARCQENGLDILITCTHRSSAEQNELYAQGRTKPGKIVTRARGGQSAHNFELDGKPAARAFDIVPLYMGKPIWRETHPDWQKAGEIGMALGLNWYGRPGAPFREFPHFELPKEML